MVDVITAAVICVEETTERAWRARAREPGGEREPERERSGGEGEAGASLVQLINTSFCESYPRY